MSLPLVARLSHAVGGEGRGALLIVGAARPRCVMLLAAALCPTAPARPTNPTLDPNPATAPAASLSHGAAQALALLARNNSVLSLDKRRARLTVASFCDDESPSLARRREKLQLDR